MSILIQRVTLTFDDGNMEIVQPQFYRASTTEVSITFDSLEEFSGFGGVGSETVASNCDTDGLYVWAYKKCPYVPIVPPDISKILSESVQMTVLSDKVAKVIDLGLASWEPLLWTDCGPFYYKIKVDGSNPSLIKLLSS